MTENVVKNLSKIYVLKSGLLFYKQRNTQA